MAHFALLQIADMPYIHRVLSTFIALVIVFILHDPGVDCKKKDQLVSIVQSSAIIIIQFSFSFIIIMIFIIVLSFGR